MCERRTCRRRVRSGARVEDVGTCATFIRYALGVSYYLEQSVRNKNITTLEKGLQLNHHHPLSVTGNGKIPKVCTLYRDRNSIQNGINKQKLISWQVDLLEHEIYPEWPDLLPKACATIESTRNLLLPFRCPLSSTFRTLCT